MTPTAAADQVFLQHILPRALRHAAVRFRSIRNQHDWEDLTQEVLIYCLKWTRLLLQRGKDPRHFPTALAAFGVQAVKNGRRACGMLKSKDVLSHHAQVRFGFRVQTIPDQGSEIGSDLHEALCDNTLTPPDEQAAFRIDFPAWLATLTERDRRLVAKMLRGVGTGVLAGMFGVSPARISQLRREFFSAWRSFHGEPVAADCRIAPGHLPSP